MSKRARNAPPFSLFAFQDIITSVTGIMILVTLMLAMELIHRKETLLSQETEAVSSQITDALADSHEMAEQLARNLEEIRRMKDQIHAQSEELKVVAQIDASSIPTELERLRQVIAASEEERKRLLKLLIDVENRSEEARLHMNQLAALKQKIQEERMRVETLTAQLDELRKSNHVVYNPVDESGKAAWLVEISNGGLDVAQPGKSKYRSFATVDAFCSWAKAQNTRTHYFVLLVKPSGGLVLDQVREELRSAGFEIGFDLLGENQSAMAPDSGS